MVLRERISEHAYVFRSNMYAKVNAGLITTPEGCVLIDTLPYPEETQEIANFVRRRLRSQVKYIIFTHSHADHVYGAYLFPDADIIGHLYSRKLLLTQTRPALIKAHQTNPALGDVRLRLPSILVEKESAVRLGGATLIMRHSPGHAPDVISVYYKEEKVLFASDAMMSVPYFVYGDINNLRRTLKALAEVSPLEDMVQGHGEVLLRGEVKTIIGTHLDYLDKVEAHVDNVIRNGLGSEVLLSLDVEACGIPRITLEGLAGRLHRENLASLYTRKIRRIKQARARQKAS
jgi:glyoxylase-like metal-dependent hydrolase (beta-lactamase superfamily II)